MRRPHARMIGPASTASPPAPLGRLFEPILLGASGRRAAAALAAVLWFGAPAASAQDQSLTGPASVFSLAPALLREADEISAGLRWELERSVGGSFRGDVLPRRPHAGIHSAGTVAIHPERNPEDLRAGAEAGLFVAIRRPPTNIPDDPEEAPTGGFNLGSARFVGQGWVETDQELEEANGRLGGAFAYTQSRQDGLWPYLPAAVRVGYAAVLPLRSELRDAAGIDDDTHGRLDLNVVWHVPILSSPLTFHADVRYWEAHGLDVERIAAVDFADGAFTSLALAYGMAAPIARLRLDEVFVRWSGGRSPVEPVDEDAWMIGIVVGTR